MALGTKKASLTSDSDRWSMFTAQVMSYPSASRTASSTSSPSPSTCVILTTRWTVVCARSASQRGRLSSRSSTARRHRSRSASSSSISSPSPANSAVVSGTRTSMKAATSSARLAVSSASGCPSSAGCGAVASIDHAHDAQQIHRVAAVESLTHLADQRCVAEGLRVRRRSAPRLPAPGIAPRLFGCAASAPVGHGRTLPNRGLWRISSAARWKYATNRVRGRGRGR